MPAARTPAAARAPLVLIHGDDDFSVSQRARELHRQWCAEVGGLDHETIDGGAANAGEALRALARLREALQTLPFFGSGKVIWLQGCTFLGDDRIGTSQGVTDALAALGDELKRFDWRCVRLLLSAGAVDRRRSFYKTLEKLGTVVTLNALTVDAKGWADQAELIARKHLRALGKDIADEALSEWVALVGPHAGQLALEAEKLALFVGDRREVTFDDVTRVVTRSKHARAFALGDALGDRDLPRLLRTLDEEFWAMKSDKERTVIGLLYGLIAKVRVLLLLKEMLHLGWVKPEADFDRFKAQLERIPAQNFPTDRRFNPLAVNPYVLFKALPQVRKYRTDELVQAMERLLECNCRLVSQNPDPAMVLQQALVQIVGSSRPTLRRAVA